MSSPASMAETISLMRSMTASTALTSAPSGVRRPARQSASASSAAWLRASRRGNSKKPQLPFTVWTKRKMLSSRAGSPGSASQSMISPTRAASISRHSATDSALSWSIGSASPSRLSGSLWRPGVNAALSLNGKRGPDHQEFARRVGKTERTAALRRQLVCEPGTGGARLDRSLASGYERFTESGVEENSRSFAPYCDLDAVRSALGADIQPASPNQRIAGEQREIKEQSNRALRQFLVLDDPAELDFAVTEQTFESSLRLSRVNLVAEPAPGAEGQAEEFELVCCRPGAVGK